MNMDLTVHVGSVQVSATDGEQELQFASREFDHTVAHELKTFVDGEIAVSVGLVMIIVERWQPWFWTALQTVVPTFPQDILYDFESEDARVQSTASLPAFSSVDSSLSFVMDHIDIFRKRGNGTTNALDLGTCEVRRLALATWICPSQGIKDHPSRSVAVMIGIENRDILHQLQGHYFGNDRRRWDRLSGLPYWLYLDLFAILTRWDKVWGVARGTILHREAELQGCFKAPPILSQARALHHDTATNIALREHIRVHKASVEEFDRGIQVLEGNMDSIIDLSNRTWIIVKALEHYQSAAETNLEQLQNLLSLAFNIETVAQGHNVARLNLFAFIFLPLSFVASLFGITTFTASPKWYPVAAVGTLFMTGLLIWGTRLVQHFWEERNTAGHLSNTTTRRHQSHRYDETPTDIEMYKHMPEPSVDIAVRAPPSPGSKTPELRTTHTILQGQNETDDLQTRLHSNLTAIVPDVRVNNQARGSRINASEVSYYVSRQPASQNRMVTHERRVVPRTARSSQFTFLQRQSMPSDMEVGKEREIVREPSPTRPGRSRLQPPSRTK